MTTEPNIDYKYASVQIVGTDPLDRMSLYSSYQTPEEMLRRIYSYSAICADKHASFISTVPLRLYRRTSNAPQEATKTIRVVDKNRKKWLLDWNGVGHKTAIWAEQAGEIEEVVDAPILKLLSKPNEQMLGLDFAYSLAWARATTGNSYIYIEMNGNTPSAMYVMFPQYVRPVIDKGILIGYSYGDRSTEIFSLDEVLHQKYRPSRYSQVYGECPLHSVLMAADILNAQNLRELCFQENDCRPSFAIKVPQEASPQQMIDTENRFNSKMKGHKQSGKFIVVKDSEITPLGFSPKDLEGMNLRREMKQEIFAAYGISETEFSTNDANLASSVTGNLQFYRNIKPLLIKNAEEYTNALIPLFYPDAEEGEYFFAYDEIMPQATKPQLTPAEKVNLGIISINEMRSELGLAPIEGGDRIRINGQLLETLDAMNPLAGLTEALAAEQPVEQPAVEPKVADMQSKGYSVTDGMVEEANRGLAWREEYGRGGTEVGVARARDISNRRELSEDTVMRMVSYFARHEVDKQAQGWNTGEEGYPSAGRIAWALWGGDAGRSWANNIADSLDTEKSVSTNTIPNTHCWEICSKKDCDCDTGSIKFLNDEVLPPTNPDAYPSAYLRVDERNELWRKKSYCDHKTETKMARQEMRALLTVVRDLYLKFANSFQIDASGEFDTTNFEGMLAGKLGEYLYSSLVRGNQDGQVRLARTKNKAAMPSLDVVPERALETLNNYVINLARVITQNERDALKGIIETGLREGKAIGVITQEIKTLLNENATFKAERIARTETARAYVQGQSIAWQDAGVTKVKPMLAPNSCTICQEFVQKNADGYNIDTSANDRVPVHPNCRCDEYPITEE